MSLVCQSWVPTVSLEAGTAAVGLGIHASMSSESILFYYKSGVSNLSLQSQAVEPRPIMRLTQTYTDSAPLTSPTQAGSAESMRGCEHNCPQFPQWPVGWSWTAKT